MPQVVFVYQGREFKAQAQVGETLLEVALNHQIPLMHVCGGFCACTTCHVRVQEGAANCSGIEEDESERLQYADAVSEQSRLSCQTKVFGDLKVEIVQSDL